MHLGIVKITAMHFMDDSFVNLGEEVADMFSELRVYTSQFWLYNSQT